MREHKAELTTHHPVALVRQSPHHPPQTPHRHPPNPLLHSPHPLVRRALKRLHSPQGPPRPSLEHESSPGATDVHQHPRQLVQSGANELNAEGCAAGGD